MTTIFPLWAFCLADACQPSSQISLRFFHFLASLQPASSFWDVLNHGKSEHNTHIKCTWGKSQQGFEQCLEWLLYCYGTATFTEAKLKMLTVHPNVASYCTISCESSSSVCYLQHCLKPQVNDSWRQAGVHLWDKHAVQKGQRNRGRMGACDHGDKDNWGVRGGEVFPVSWLYGPVSSRHTHTHIWVPHNDHTYTREFHS